jgi:hypothetical protein
MVTSKYSFITVHFKFGDQYLVENGKNVKKITVQFRN